MESEATSAMAYPNLPGSIHAFPLPEIEVPACEGETFTNMLQNAMLETNPFALSVGSLITPAYNFAPSDLLPTSSLFSYPEDMHLLPNPDPSPELPPMNLSATAFPSQEPGASAGQTPSLQPSGHTILSRQHEDSASLSGPPSSPTSSEPTVDASKMPLDTVSQLSSPVPSGAEPAAGVNPRTGRPVRERNAPKLADADWQPSTRQTKENRDPCITSGQSQSASRKRKAGPTGAGARKVKKS